MNKVNIFLISILVLALIVLGITLIQQKKNSTNDMVKLITDEKILDKSFNFSKIVYDIVKRNKLTLANENNTIIITWQMYIPNIGGEFYWTSNYTKDKPIIRIGKSPHIYYNAKQNKLKIIAKYQHSTFDNHYPLIELSNINLQKWNTYTVIIQNYKIRIYINGKLQLSKQLDNGIDIDDYKTSNVMLGEVNNNLFGKIRNFNLHFKNLSHNKLSSLNL
jgi:hypothetical protein